MKAVLFKKAEGWYNLFQDNIGIGSTHSELQGYKLSKQNCDEIFGVIDVEKLAEEWVFETNGHKWSNNDDTIGDNFASYKEGFNKALELNEDKVFTLDDIKKSINWAWRKTDREEHILIIDEHNFIQSLRQPTEIEVEIEMENYGYCEGCRKSGMWHCAHADTCGNAETRERPKLDENGCLILKKID